MATSFRWKVLHGGFANLGVVGTLLFSQLPIRVLKFFGHRSVLRLWFVDLVGSNGDHGAVFFFVNNNNVSTVGRIAKHARSTATTANAFGFVILQNMIDSSVVKSCSSTCSTFPPGESS